MPETRFLCQSASTGRGGRGFSACHLRLEVRTCLLLIADYLMFLRNEVERERYTDLRELNQTAIPYAWSSEISVWISG